MAQQAASNMVKLSPLSDPRSSVDWLKSLSVVPTSGYVLILTLVIGLLLLLSADFGMAWDVPAREYSAFKAYIFYLKGFYAAQFLSNQNPYSIYYGPAIDLLIKIAQHGTR